MNFFCRIFGHTWIHATEGPKVQWNNDKGLVELFPKVVEGSEGEEAEVRFLRRCVRCGEERPWKTA